MREVQYVHIPAKRQQGSLDGFPKSTLPTQNNGGVYYCGQKEEEEEEEEQLRIGDGCTAERRSLGDKKNSNFKTIKG